MRAAPERAASDGCRAARAYYSIITSDVLAKLIAYHRCVVRSDDRDDCSGEFLFLNCAWNAYKAAMAAVSKAFGAGHPAPP